MPAATDHLRGSLWTAILRRRAPQWLLAIAPLAIAAYLLPVSGTIPAASASGAAGTAAAGISSGAAGTATAAAAAGISSAAASTAAAGISSAAIGLAAAIVLCIIWIIADALRWRSRINQQWPSWLNEAIPQLEDSSTLLAEDAKTPIAKLQQQRLQARLAEVLTADDYKAIANKRARIAILPIALSLLAVGSAAAWHGKQTAPAEPQQTAQTNKPIIDGEVHLRITPPAYTGVQAFETGARDIQIPQYSEVRWCVRNPSGVQPMVELSDGQTLPVTPECAKLRIEDSLFWRTRGAGATRYNIRVTPDQTPQVTIAAPTELIHLLAKDAKAVEISVSAKDDYAIVRASLHMTLARGSGENIRFSDKEVPLPQSSDPKSRNWKKQWTLAELGMEPGDELYFFVRATDNAPSPHSAQSPTYTLRLPGPDAESLESTALPTMTKPENLRSQRQIIIDTEQLVADLKAHPDMPAATLRNRSELIAADQTKLRLRYGQFLGEESSLFGEEEHEEHHESGGAPERMGSEISVMKAFGHAHDQEGNATIFDPQTKAVLRRALAAMWDAEKALRAISPKTALPPEYKALDAIKELQSAERVYLHRTAFVPPALKEEKRMSGDIVGAMSYKREQGAANDSVPAEVRELVQALSQDGALPALWSKAARDTIATRITDQEQKLSAQRAVQDVLDGCVPCRAELRAWLRGTLAEAPVLLQARPSAETAFSKAWSGKEQAK